MTRRRRQRTDADSAPAEGDDAADALAPSKSAIKRQLAAVQALALELIGLGEKELLQLPLDDETRAALQSAARLERRARQRQLRYASGLLAAADVAAVRAALEDLQRPRAEQVRSFHEVEAWRDALLAGEARVIDELAERFATLDRQHLMQLVRKARSELDQGRAPAGARLLFRYLTILNSER